MSHHAVVAVGSLSELQTHGKLTASLLRSHLVSTVHCELDKCPQNELTVTHAGRAFCDFHVSSQ